MDYSYIIIKRTKDLYTQIGFTINKLTTKSGITQSTVENLMSEKTKNPKLKTLHMFSIGLDMTVSELLNFLEMNSTVFEHE